MNLFQIGLLFSLPVHTYLINLRVNSQLPFQCMCCNKNKIIEYSKLIVYEACKTEKKTHRHHQDKNRECNDEILVAKILNLYKCFTNTIPLLSSAGVGGLISAGSNSVIRQMKTI